MRKAKVQVKTSDGTIYEGNEVELNEEQYEILRKGMEKVARGEVGHMSLEILNTEVFFSKEILSQSIITVLTI